MSIPRIKFSPKLARGSCAERKAYRNILSKQICDNVLNLYAEGTNYVPIRTIEREYKKFMPEKIHFSVKKTKPEDIEKYSGAVVISYIGTKTHHYTLRFPAIDNAMSKFQMTTFMHESVHFFDFLLNPKVLKNKEDVHKRGLSGVVNTFYDSVYYKKENLAFSSKSILKVLRSTTEKLIKHFEPQDRILILKYIRQQLLFEVDAYNEGQKYAKELRNTHYMLNTSYVLGLFKDYMFEEKAKLVSDLLYKEIMTERRRLAKQRIKTVFSRIRLVSINFLKKMLNL